MGAAAGGGGREHHHAGDGHRHRPHALLPPAALPRQGRGERGRQPQVQGPGLALHGCAVLQVPALRRRAPGVHQEVPGPVPLRLRVSREQKNAAGQKMYIQTKMAEYAEELWELMQSPKTHVYMCGLKGMERGMEECFSPLAEKNGMA